MNKDIIYIDVEDDITAIIGKVKDAKEKIVALVPPKRIGVLQSAVNLRLLARAAGQADKRLVLITNNAALTALASAAKLPIAKNLQSKPEIAQIPALDIDDGNDVIDGAQLPVGDLQRTADIGTAALSDPAVDEIVRSDATPLPIRAAAPTDGQSPRTGKVKKGTKVPNFNKFRKKLLLIIAAAVLLLGFAVWALFFAPRATVIISARTTESSMNKQVVMGANVDTSASAGTLKTTLQQVKNDVSGSFDATGKKDVGEKATGTVQFTSDSFSSLLVGIDIPAGTELSSSSGNVYVTDTSVTLTTSGNTKTTGITAVKNGTSYNGASGSMTGAPSSVNATIVDATSGGSSKTITIVTSDDIQRATNALKDENVDAVKKKLTEQFGSTAIVIDASFANERDVKSSPAVGEEANNGKATLTGSVTYSLSGVAKNELDAYLKAHFSDQLDNPEKQRIYDNGANTVTFTNVDKDKDTFTANLSATAKIGPKIDDTAVKELAKGKRYGDIQSSIVAIQGVDSVDIKFWPFWVNKAPNDSTKITVEFKLDESN